MTRRKQNLDHERIEFILAEYNSLRAEILERLGRVAQLVKILLSSSLVYFTAIFIPVPTSDTGSLVQPEMAMSQAQPLTLLYFFIILIVPLLGFAIEAMCTSETDAVLRIGIYIRQNIERKVGSKGYGGWEDWLERQDKALRRRTSERMSRTARLAIICLYCLASSGIAGYYFAISWQLNPVIVIGSISIIYALLGYIGIRKLDETKSVELTSNFYEVLVIDIDGCLTNNQGVISDANIAAIKEVKKLAVMVIIATGRPSFGTWKILEDLDLGGLHVVSNGACITSWPDKQNTIRHPLESTHISAIVSHLESLDIAWAAFSDDKVYCNEKRCAEISKDLVSRGDLLEGEVEIEGIKDFVNWNWASAGNISKVWCALKIDEVVKSRKVLDHKIEGIVGTRTTNETVELFQKDVSKRDAVEAILETSEKNGATILVLGDHDHDIGLMEWADHALAPSNASISVKNLKNVDTFPVSNDDDFVAHALSSYYGV